MRIRLAILLVTLPLAAFAQDAINPDVINPDATDEGDGTQIVVPQKKAVSPPTDLRPAAVPSPVQVDAAACAYATAHVPSPGTNYEPGVDVNGNPVAPADLAPSHPIQFPSRFAIPITSNVAKMLRGTAAATATTARTATTAGTTTTGTATTAGAPAAATGTTAGGSAPGFRADAYLGMVTVENGRLSYNGQPLGDDPDEELAALCRNAASPAAPKMTSGAR